MNYLVLGPYTFSQQDIVLQIEEVYTRDQFSTQYKAKIVSINGQKIDKKIYTLSTIPNNFSLEKGMIIKSLTQLELVKNFDTFNYQKFLLSKNIYTRNYITVLYTLDQELNMFTHIESWRQKAIEILTKLYPSEERIFLAGILF